MMQVLTINTDAFEMTDEQFYQFCAQNKDIKIERDRNKNIIIMSPTSGNTGNRNFEILGQLYSWNREHQLGYAFDSSTGFLLPNKAIRSPDAAWLQKDRWENLSKEDKETFPPVCPDFVIELKSKSDVLETLQEKMQEWKDNGCLLGWLIDLDTEKVYIYRPEKEVFVISSFTQLLSGEPLLKGFELDLSRLKS